MAAARKMSARPATTAAMLFDLTDLRLFIHIAELTLWHFLNDVICSTAPERQA